MKWLPLILAVALLSINSLVLSSSEDLYELLGVARDASVKEIRKAFKALAVKLHPDKNKDDSNADAVFIKITKAYEVLKDPDTRKKYDLYGDTGEATPKKQSYHSYSYYRDQFGIYDDDPLIVTLSKADYEVNVLDKNQAWFVNFYSPNCHHCHELAPTWRKLAKEFEAVIRIAAVNCEEDWSLCYQLSIQSYPTLLYYEKESHLYEGEKYVGPRNINSLRQFILGKITTPIEYIFPNTWDNINIQNQLRLLVHCPKGVCDQEKLLKLTAMLEGLMSVAKITNDDLWNKIATFKKIPELILWKGNEPKNETTGKINKYPILGEDVKEILNNILDKLPNPKELDSEAFQEARKQLREGSENPWLICFYMGKATDLDLQLKRLPALLPNFNIGLIHCGKNAPLCSSLHVSRYPAWGVIKVGGAFELHHGRDVLHDITAFARDSSTSTNLHALSPADFNNLVVKGEGTWFIDWFAPWCPPCRKLMPELRRASQHFDASKVQFGTIDCTLHSTFCSQQGIRSYPTTMLYKSNQISYFHGVPNEAGIVEFVQDMLNPLVIALDASSFAQLRKKPENELWIVDYFAPWCAPCQRLAPEWRNLAKQVAEFDEVRVASVDCVAYPELCNEQNVQSYPTIRLYPLGSRGLNSVAMYKGHRDALSLKRWILDFLPSVVERFDAKEFKKHVLGKKHRLPWLIDFYAPWCGHCTHFEPIFRTIAKKLEDVVRSAKVDCEAERELCRELRVTVYPTVILYMSPSERYEITSQVQSEVIQYVKKLISQKHNQHDEL